MSVTVKVRNNNLEGAILAFRSKVKNAKIIEQYKEKQEYKKPSTLKREKRKICRNDQ